jgi:outer membrane lipoprotein-sorting protein
MRPNKTHRLNLFLLGATLILLTGCAGLTPRDARIQDPRAALLAARVTSINHGLRTFKGTARVTLTETNTSQRLKIAWAALLPDKIRLTILKSGFPLETILADGTQVFFVSHTGEHSPHRIKAANPSLQPVISMPIRIREIISLLAGQIPMEPFDRAILSTAGPAAQTTLVLTRKWRGTVGTVRVDPKDQIRGFQRLKSNGEPIYSAERKSLKNYGSHTIPMKTVINDPSGKTLTLEITSFYPDVTVKRSVFSLTEIE